MRVGDRAMDLPAGEGARLLALGLLEEASAAAAGLASGSGEEPLHDFRVALRRLRSILRTFRPWLEDRVRPRHERRLRRIARSTNEARDAEVQLGWLAARLGDLSGPRLRPGYDRLAGRLAARAQAGPDAVRLERRFRRAAEKLRERLGAPVSGSVTSRGTPSFGAAIASRIREQVEALSRRMAVIRGPSDREGVHRARIEGKRLRYLLEPLQGGARASVREAIGHLKRLQDVLGELHDAHVLEAEAHDVLANAAAEREPRAPPGSKRASRSQGGPSPRAGLLALLRLGRERRDERYAALARFRRAGGMRAVASGAGALADALEGRASGKPGARQTSRSPSPGP